MLAAGDVALIERPVAVPGALHARLPPGVGELNRRESAEAADQLGDAFEPRHLLVRPQPGATVGDAPSRLDRRRLDEHHGRAALGERRVMGEVPLVHEAVRRRVLAHGRDHDAVLKRKPA